MKSPTLKGLTALALFGFCATALHASDATTAANTTSAIPTWDTSSIGLSSTTAPTGSGGSTVYQTGSAILPTIAGQSGQYGGAVTQIGETILSMLAPTAPSPSEPTINTGSGTVSGGVFGSSSACADAQQNNADDYALEMIN